MIIYCKICKWACESDKPDLEAQKEVLEKIATHLGYAHRKQAARLARLLTAVQTLAATYLLIRQFVEIPPKEEELLKSFDENEEALMRALGLEPEHEEEEVPPNQAANV